MYYPSKKEYIPFLFIFICRPKRGCVEGRVVTRENEFKESNEGSVEVRKTVVCRDGENKWFDVRKKSEKDNQIVKFGEKKKVVR